MVWLGGETASIEELIRRADAALYQAKSRGRDRVVVDAGGRLSYPARLHRVASRVSVDHAVAFRRCPSAPAGAVLRALAVQQRMHEHRGQDHRHADVEPAVQFALLAQQHDRQHDRVDRLQVGHHLRAERAEVAQRHQRQRERQQGAAERQQPAATACRAGPGSTKAGPACGSSGASRVRNSGAGAQLDDRSRSADRHVRPGAC